MSNNRDVYTLSDQWRFYRGSCEGAESACYSDEHWEVVFLPHTVREEAADCSGGYNYLGPCWYRRRIQLNLHTGQQRAVLRVGGAKHIARLYIDGQMICEHTGGYIPFYCDISEFLEDGAEHILAIWMDNSDMPDIPPGKPQGELDFCYFGGLYRDVTLTVTSLLHITEPLEEDEVAGGGLFVQYADVSDNEATLLIRTHIRNRSSPTRFASLHLACLDKKSHLVAEQHTEIMQLEPGTSLHHESSLVIQNPALWHPDHPNRYRLTATIIENGIQIDSLEQYIGIRTITFTGQGFHINGKRLQLLGANRHQEYVHIGDALPPSLHREDARLLKESGFNLIRTGHYPQSEAFMDACDELGLLCIVPTPGWQWFRDNELFLSHVYSDIRQMIRWHRNRPSVVLWEPILNETHYSEIFARRALEVTHAEYPGTQCYAAADAGHPWTEHYGVSYPVPAREGQASFVREFGDLWLEQYGRKGTQFRCTRGVVGFYPGGESAMLASTLQRAKVMMEILNNSSLAGGALWAGIDTNRGYINNIAAVGAFDLYRLPKWFEPFLRSQKQAWSSDDTPFIFIASWWQEVGADNRDIYIFSNCENVELRLNGRLLKGGHYVEELDQLPFPPILFTGVPFEKGELVALGLRSQLVCCSHKVRTPEETSCIQLRVEPRNDDWVADGADICVIRAELLDQHGSIVPKDGVPIIIEVSGHGHQVGKYQPWTGVNSLTTEAGVASVLIRSTSSPGSVEVIASSPGLASSRLTLSSVSSLTLLLSTAKLAAPAQQPVYEADKQQLFSVGSATRIDDSWADIAMHRPAKASSELPHQPAAFATAGDPHISWAADPEVRNAYWEVDLQNLYHLQTYRIVWGSDRHHYTCRIIGSKDGVNFEQLEPAQVFSGQDLGSRTLAATVPVRYVRLEILDATGPISVVNVYLQGEKASE